MSLNAFIKNLFGTGEATETATADMKNRNENLSGANFKKQLEACDNAVLLDVRTAGEYAQGSIPGAKNIDFMSPAFVQKIQNLDKEATYFLYCLSGNRSGQACKLMHKQGFDVRNLSGGIGAFPL
jgi:rhodanese-related sulfurtransferase